MDEEVRGQLIKDIISRKHPAIQLYAWEVHHDGPHLVADQAFFNQQEAIKSWYINNRMWEQADPPAGVVVYSWKSGVDDIVKHAKGASVREMRIPRKREMDVAILPSSVQEDMQRTLKNQG